MDISLKNRIELKNSGINNCIHARKIIQTLDANLNDPRIQFFKNHSKSCSVCQKKLKEVEKSLVRLDFFIPKPRANSELKNEYQVEIKNLFKNLGVVPNLNKKMKYLDRIKYVVKDIESILNNKKIILKAFLVAGISYTLLNLLLK